MFQDPESMRVWYAIVYGGWGLTIFAYAYYCLIERTHGKRVLAALVAVLLIVGATVYAADGQPVLNPCSSCQGVAWNSFEYWLFMCWAC